jgi:hypothetical protein
MLFAWRSNLPTFTDASLIAAGTGALLWAVNTRPPWHGFRALADGGAEQVPDTVGEGQPHRSADNHP